MQSPDSPDNDGDYSSLTPRTEAKYNQIDEEFTLMLQRSQINGTKVRLHRPIIYKLNGLNSAILTGSCVNTHLQNFINIFRFL